MSTVARSPARQLVTALEWTLHGVNLVASGARLLGTPIYRWPVVLGETVALSTAIHGLAQAVRKQTTP